MEALGKHAPFLLLICLPVAAGWFMLEMACLQLVLSILCFCEESDLQIVELCHSPVRFSCHQGLFRFPEVGGRRGGLESLTSSYVTEKRHFLCELPRPLPPIRLSVYPPVRAQQYLVYVALRSLYWPSVTHLKGGNCGACVDCCTRESCIHGPE